MGEPGCGDPHGTMDPDTDSESGSILEDAFRYILDTMSKEELLSLTIEDKALENLEAEKDFFKYFLKGWEEGASLTHFATDEEEALGEGLGSLKTEMEEKEDTDYRIQEMDAMGDKDENQREQEFIQRFLKEFPQVKCKLEVQIAELRALADKADKVQRDCTISNIVTNSTSIVSGILTIIGMSLAPVTAGASLALSATGLGLGMASSVTGVCTIIAKQSIKSSIKNKASNLESPEINTEEMVKEVLQDVAPKLMSVATDCVKDGEKIVKSVNAIKLIQASPKLASQVTCFTNAGKVSIQTGEQVQKVLEGTVLAMTKGARVFGVAMTGISILASVGSLVKDSVDLHKGSKTSSAKKMRQDAQELEKKLEELVDFHAYLLGSDFVTLEEHGEQRPVWDKGM
ncbi:apolipoprotein L2-like [Sorex araneus]|uniref:apolipoprotein L2-like n=1 Tax=Sorex araneus TaxID=42254 RepID=UPI0024338669|nr:apolipoprotein L2-like [Sorex araneus]